jgi:hypothetical protein
MTTHDNSEANHGAHSVLKTWIIITLILLFIVFKDSLSFFVVGDLGQPDWDYRPMPDVPGESAYAIYPSMPYPQHIRGEKGE